VEWNADDRGESLAVSATEGVMMGDGVVQSGDERIRMRSGGDGPQQMTASSGYRSWLPRLTSRVMVDLRLWMTAFGLLIGISFPFVVVLLGVPVEIAIRPAFFAATLLAGLAVALVNSMLAQTVVGVRLRALVAGMRRVEGTLVDATYAGDWAQCDPASCKVPVDSVDELGEVASSFNRLIESLATSHRVADGVSALSEALASNLDMGAMAESTLRELLSRTDGAAAALLVVSNGEVALAGSIGVREADGLVSSEAVLTTLRSEQPRVLHLPPDVVISGAMVDVVPQEVRVLPVRYGVLTVGVLVVSFTMPCTAESAAVLDATLPGLAVALHNAINHQDLQRVAALDALTGVYNRRFGMQRLAEEFSRSLRSGDPLGLLMIDLDHFKAINDTYGHLVGDRVLLTVVGAARHVLREGDVLIRYGGEEFLIILPGAGRDDLTKMAERVRRATADAEIAEGDQRIKVTVSIGGAGLPDQTAGSPEKLIGIADAALYAAKTSGRDRAIIA
jgi:diguanylate cyclase (GGDEF)-like protein